MAKKETNLTLGISEPEKVHEFMANLTHPLKEVVQYVRELILSIDTKIGEGIYWNAPVFFFTGEMKPFEPKDFRRYIVGFVFNRQDCIRMVFLQGAGVIDQANLLEGNFKDNRKLVVFTSLEDAQNKAELLKDIVQQLVEQME